MRPPGPSPRRVCAALLTVLTTITIGLTAIPARASNPGVTFTVNSNGDGSDTDLGILSCDDGTGHCTLRAAIEQANVLDTLVGDGNYVTFNLPAGQHIISPGSPLPAVSGNPLAFLGNSQPAYAGTPLVRIDGSGAGANPGFRLTTVNSEIKGLSITGFAGGAIEVTADGVILRDNYVGINPDGVTSPGNGTSGVTITNAAGVEVSGSVISGNSGPLYGDGIRLDHADSTTIHHDIIGLTPAGDAVVNTAGSPVGNPWGNAGYGIEVYESTGVTIGPGNTISGSNFGGIRLWGTHGTSVAGNKIGLGIDGVTPFGNQHGLGIEIHAQATNGSDDVGTTIGGNSPADANIIGANGWGGISANNAVWAGAAVVRNLTIQGNYIGTTPTGENVGNGGGSGSGIAINGSGGNHDILVGGTAAGAGNVIASNAGDGVAVGAKVDGPAENSVRILGNSIHDNGRLGINLDGGTQDASGVNANDGAGDPDTGPNGLQNFPGLSSPTNTSVDFNLASTSNTQYDIEVFANAACDASGHGEGGTPIASASGTSDPDGILAGTITFATQAAGTSLSATATDVSTGSTSEFSTCESVPSVPSAGQSTLLPTSSSILANGTSTQVLTVQAKDAAGANITTGGANVVITKQSGTGTVGEVNNNGDGTYTATVTSDTSPGSGVFVATMGGNPVKSGTETQTEATVTYAAFVAIIDLAVTSFTHAPASPPAGRPITYTAVVTNNGVDPATGAQLTDTLPAELSGAKVCVSPDDCSAFPTHYAAFASPLDLGTIAPGASVTVTIVATSSTTPGAIANAVSVAGDAATSDTNVDNDSATDNLTTLDATPGFKPATSYNLTGTGADTSAIASLDANSYPDIAVTNPGSGTVSILLGNGDGTYQPATSVNIGGTPTFLAAGDFNGDGNTDLVANTGGGDLTLEFGNGDGTFDTAHAKTISVGAAASPRSIAAVQLGGTGPGLDLAVADSSGTDLTVLVGNNDGTFTKTDFGTSGFNAVDVGDVNFDGNADVVLASSTKVRAFLGDGTGAVNGQPATTIASTAGSPSLQLTDLNGDGLLDAVVGGNAQVLLGTGDGTFHAATEVEAAAPASFATAADFNRDSKPDLEVGTTRSNTNSHDLTGLLGTGDGTFTAGSNADLQYAVTGGVSVGDLNNDHAPDLVLPNGDDGKVTILLDNLAPPISNLALSQSPDTTQAGFGSIAESGLDFSNVSLGDGIVEGGAGPLAAQLPAKQLPAKQLPAKQLPAKQLPAKQLPAKQLPAKQLPAKTLPGFPDGVTPLQFVTLGDVLHHQMQNAPLLTSVQITVPGGWPAVIPDLLQTKQLQDLTLNDVIMRNDVSSLPFDDFDFSQTVIGSWPLSALMLGETTLSQIPLPAGTSWDEVLNGTATVAGMADLCAGPILTNTAQAATMNQTLGDLASARCPLGLMPWGEIKLTAFGPGVLHGTMLGRFAFAGIDASKIAYTRGTDAVTLGDLLVSDLVTAPTDVRGQVVECTVVDCVNPGTLTLGGLAGDPSQNVTDKFNQAGVFGDLLGAPNASTILGDMTLGDVLLGILQPQNFPYENVSLSNLLQAAPTAGQGTVTYTAAFDAACPIAQDAKITVNLPSGDFRYVGQGASFAFGTQIPAGAPTTNGKGALTWVIPGSACVDTNPIHGTLTFQVVPGPVAGTFSSSVGASAAGGFSQHPVSVATPLTLTKVNAGQINDAVNAPQIQPDTLITGQATSTSDVSYYRIPVTQADVGKLVSVYLSHFDNPDKSTDDDLVMYGASGAIQNLQDKQLPAKQLPAKTVGDQEGCLPTGYILQPQTLQDVPQLTTSNGDYSLRGFSTNHSGQEEVVCTVVQSTDIPQSGTGYFTIQVSHYAGGADGSYVLRYSKRPKAEVPACQGPSLSNPAVTRGTLPAANVKWTGNLADASAAPKTLFLMNTRRYGQIYGQAAEDSTVAKLQTLAARPEVSGVIVPVEADPAVLTAVNALNGDACSPDLQNRVVTAINSMVRSHLATNPQYIVIIGSDDVIPFGRVLDQTTLGNQVAYASSLQFFQGVDQVLSDTPESRAFARGLMLTDDPYGSFTPQTGIGNTTVYVPNVALGRLVETPSEIDGQIDRYVSSNGQLSPSTALVTGTDFSAGTNSVANKISTIFGNAGYIVPPTNGSPSLIGDSWTQQDALCQLNGNQPPAANSCPAGHTPTNAPPGIISVNGHFNHFQTKPGAVDGTHPLLSSTDFLNTQAAAQTLLFTIGCNSGVNVQDGYVTGADAAMVSMDWAQALAQKRGSLVANTGFGYGDSERIAYSEALMRNFAQNLVAQDNANHNLYSIGQSLALAKNDYWQSLVNYSAYDVKAMQESTLYGLPMYRIGGVAGTRPATNNPLATSDPATGLPSVVVDQPSFVTSSDVRTATDGSKYFVGPGGATQVTDNRPTEPRSQTIDVSQPAADGLVLHGALVLPGLQVQNFTNFAAFFTRPIPVNGILPPAPSITDGTYPTDFVTTSSLSAIKGVSGQADTLVMWGGRFTATNPLTPNIGTQTIFNKESVRAFFAPSTSTDFTGPTILNPNTAARQLTGAVAFSVQTSSNDTLAAYVMYEPAGDNTYKAITLNRSGSLFPTGSVWAGTVPQSIDSYFIEMVDTSGNVSYSLFKGLVAPIGSIFLGSTGSISSSVSPTTPSVTVGGTKWYRQSEDVRLTSSINESIQVQVDGGAPSTITNGGSVHLKSAAEDAFGQDGARFVDYRGLSSGKTGTVVVFIDSKAPSISHAIGTPTFATGGPFVAGSTPVSVTVTDAGAGIAASSGCQITITGPVGFTPPNPTTDCQGGTNTIALGPDGTYFITTTATDLVGNAATADTFSVVLDTKAPTIVSSAVANGTAGAVYPVPGGDTYVTSSSFLRMAVNDVPASTATSSSGVASCATTSTGTIARLPGGTCAAGSNDYQLPKASNVDGPYSLTTVATDNVLNQNNGLANVLNVVLDNTSPTIGWSFPTGPSRAVPGSNPAATFISSLTTQHAATVARVRTTDPAAGPKPGSGLKACQTTVAPTAATHGPGTLPASNNPGCSVAGTAPVATADSTYTLPNTYPDGPYTLSTNASDNVNNATADTNAPVVLDNTAPVLGSCPLTDPGRSATLASAITSLTQNTFTVNEEATPPRTPFVITVGAEQMLVTKRVLVTGMTAQYTYTVTRGIAGTKGTFLAGATVKWDILARQDLLGSLSTAITSTSAPSFTVAEQRFGAPQVPFTITLENEQMIVTGRARVGAVSANTFTYTVQRGANGTTGATHASGKKLLWTGDAYGTLTGALATATAGTQSAFQVLEGRFGPQTLPFQVTIEGEQLTVIKRQLVSGSTYTYTAVRGASATPIAAHPANAPLAPPALSAVYLNGPATGRTMTIQADDNVWAGVPGSGIATNDAQTIPGTQVGSYPVTYTVTDYMGNARTKTCYYEVDYKFGGFLLPIDMGIVNSRNAGAAVPVKWKITDYDGVGQTNSNTFWEVTGSTPVASTSAACAATNPDFSVVAEQFKGGSSLQNLGGGNYQFNWSPNAGRNQCTTMTVRLVQSGLRQPDVSTFTASRWYQYAVFSFK